MGKVAVILQRLGGLTVTPGGLHTPLHRIAGDADAAYRALIAALRDSGSVAADETGWRIDRDRGWLWVYVGNRVTVFDIASGRGFDQAAAILGADFDGVIERDGCPFVRHLHQALDERPARRLTKQTSPIGARMPGPVSFRRSAKSLTAVLLLILIAAAAPSSEGGNEPQAPEMPKALTSEQPRNPPLALDPQEIEQLADDLDMTEAEAERSLRLTDAVDALERRAREEYPATFAGLWRDNSQGGRVKIAFTSEWTQRARALASGFADSALVDGVAADHALTELRTTEKSIAGDLEALAEEGIVVSALGIDIPTNRVDVRLAGSSEGADELVRQRYGAAQLLVTRQAPPVPTVCTSREACGPNDGERMRAGLYIYGPTSGCTSAFPATKGYNGSPGSGIAGVLTAGHCFDLDSWVGHNTFLLGHVRWWQYSGNQDSAWIDNHDNWPDTSQWVWQFSYDTAFAISSRADAGAGNPGDPICHSGWRRGYRCGQLLNDSLTITVADPGGNVRLDDMKEDDICSGPGDSGGPVYSGRRAHGIVSASNIHVNQDGTYRCLDPNRTYYSGIWNVEQALQVRVRTW